MSETRPRELTPEELALLQAPTSRGTDTAPLRIPPGTQIAVELLNPGADFAAIGSPKAEPSEAAGAESSGAPKSAATGPGAGKRKDK